MQLGKLGMKQTETIQIERFDFENALKKAFFTLREIPDPENKLEAMKNHLMKFIQEAQDGIFEMEIQN